jgi:hypothetical protein
VVHSGDKSKWLVTAKHILLTKKGLPFHRINIAFSRTRPNIYLPITLAEMREYGRIHINKKIDVAAIKIDQLLVGRDTVQKEYHNFGFFDSATTTNERPPVGSSVCVAGYPERNLDFNQTYLRTSRAKVIACPPANKIRVPEWPREPPSIDDCFCIYRLVKSGMSGSPVISFGVANSEPRLCGICISTVGARRGAAQPSRYIEEIIERCRCW